MIQILDGATASVDGLVVVFVTSDLQPGDRVVSSSWAVAGTVKSVRGGKVSIALDEPAGWVWTGTAADLAQSTIRKATSVDEQRLKARADKDRAQKEKQAASSKFKVGQRVQLPANAREGWRAEVGTVDAIEGRGMYIVRVKPQERGDDGIREVNESDMRPA